MAKILDGKKIRDEILAGLKESLAARGTKPTLAVILAGDDPVSAAYVGLKQKIAEKIGVGFELYRYSQNASENEILTKIRSLNNNLGINGIMVQIPLPSGFDRDKLIEAISPDKDIDGLRYCVGLSSDFFPPVVLAVARALELSGTNPARSDVVIIGRGFLVGDPLCRYFEGKIKKLVVADSSTPDLTSIIRQANVVISAVGRAGIITAEMVKESVVLIDAGTSEAGGEIRGDIDPKAHAKASFYTPVPGGIGPVTVAMLIQNLVSTVLT
ncbi:MAG: bifunctional 5,10-methylenetetrahydrofolate dehydrogenase/5,10-methenyltetrahydrofolate cyclohydrolase [Patescibacteria group bacterium]